MSLLLAITGLVSVGVAQYSGWDTKNAQINATICTWQGLQGKLLAFLWELQRLMGVAAVIRDTVYIDGGDLWWRPGYNDGSYGQVTEDGSCPLVILSP